MLTEFKLRRRAVLWTAAVLPLLAVWAAGCGSKPRSDAGGDELAVTVALPVTRPVTDYVEATGRTAAVESVEIRARVTGYLQRIKELLDEKPLLDSIRQCVPDYMQVVKLDPAQQVGFEEGEEVARGQTLFIVDPHPFKAEYDRLAAQIRVREANLRFREAELARSQTLIEKKVITPSEYEAALASRDEAAASVAASKADLEIARQDLQYTDVKSPIAGRVSRAEKTVGNVVTADTMTLTNVVSQDPMYVYFNVDERTILDIRVAVREGKIKVRSEEEIPVFVQTENETGYPHRGRIDFADNRVDPDTGSILLRGVFDNAPDASGQRPLIAGLFVRIRVPMSDPREVLMVTERAVNEDLDQKYLLIVDQEDKVQYRPVKLGRLEEGLRVIEKGIGPEDRVIIAGQQRVRPKMTVKTDVVPMPQRAPRAKPDAPEETANPDAVEKTAKPQAAEATKP